MLTVLTSIVAPPIARMVPPDATSARPSAARAITAAAALLCSGLASALGFQRVLVAACGAGEGAWMAHGRVWRAGGVSDEGSKSQ
jgi:hypothetical protein